MAGSGTTMGTAGTELVLVGADNGLVVVTSDTPLRRLNYFDGKFLRAEDMQAEQDYLRFLVQLSNRAGGSGVVNGYDTALASSGAAVTVGQGLALDALGRVLLMPIAKTMALDDLIAATARAQKTLATAAAGSADFGDCVVVTQAGATTSGQSGDLYLLTVGFLEALCGEEDVFGQICDDACVQSKDRRWRMEGVVFRAVPLTLATPLKISTAVPVNPNQLRNRVASAYFQDERQRVASLVSGTSLRESATFCLGAQAEIGDAVPLAVFARSGGVTKFLDAWTARRERMEAPPRRYWAWRLSMRPWDAFLAQVLQFQCQLHDLLSGHASGGGAGDPCATKTAAIGRAADLLSQLESWHAQVARTLTPATLAGAGAQPFQVGAVKELRAELVKLTAPTASDRLLLDGGILELPPAGYLPVDASGKLTVNEQVRAFMGPGVDLRYCIVTPDYVPHALEMRQHMDRIPLTDGIDDPTAKPKVDILVPGGRIVANPAAGGGTAYQLKAFSQGTLQTPVLGAANAAQRNQSGGSVVFAGTTDGAQLQRLVSVLRGAADHASAPGPASADSTITPGHLDLARRMAAKAAAEASPLREKAHAAVPLAELKAQGEALGAVGVTAAIDADPFQLDVSGSTGVQVDGYLSEKGQVAGLAHVTGSGTLFPRSRGTTPSGVDYVVGTVSGSYAAAGVGATSPGTSVTWLFELLRKTSGAGGTLYVRVGESAVVARVGYLAAWYTWSGDPLKGVLQVYRATANQVREGAAAQANAFVSVGASFIDIPPPPATPAWFEIDLTRDPAVLDPTEQHHVLAESALQVIASLLPNGPDWQRATEAALFPRPPSDVGSITVIGERDWVLFARRRLCTCSDEAVTQKLPDRRYHVYAFEAGSDREAAAWAKAVLSGGSSDLPPSRFLGFVDFDASTADPVDPAGLRGELDPVKGEALRYVVTASDYGDGVSEEGRRRAHLEQAVGGVLDVTGASPVDLAAVPKPFEGRVDGGQTVHGVVILVTVQQLAVANVYGLQLEMAQAFLFTNGPSGQLTVRDPVDFANFPPERRVKFLLGSVTFRAGAADQVELAAVVDRWKNVKAGLAHVVEVTATASDDGDADREARAIAGDAASAGESPQFWQTHAPQGLDTDPQNVNAMVFLVMAPAQLRRRGTRPG